MILGGVGRAEGAVITKWSSGEGHPSSRGEDYQCVEPRERTSQQGSLHSRDHLDHWADVLPFDDRRSPAYDCMRTRLGGPSGYNASGLYNVLSATPNLNRLTVFTTLACRHGSV